MKNKPELYLLAAFAVLFYLSVSITPAAAAEIKVPDYGSSPEDRFGHSAAISDNYAIVGAYKDDDTGKNSGAAYILEYNGNNWIQAEKLSLNESLPYGYFAYSVSISGDYAIVGAFNNDGIQKGSGAAYIFKRSASRWTLQKKLTAQDGERNDYFGYSVSISGDLAIVGAYRDDDKGNDAGAAYIFKNTGGNWIQQSKIKAQDGAPGDNFGRSVSISGNYAIAGAIHDGDKGRNSGAVYIFQYNGSSWEQAAKRFPSDGAANDFFGFSVSISNDYAIAGSPADDDKGENSGSAYIFKNNGGVWTQNSKLTAGDGSANDFFGRSVSISGNYAAVGADSDDVKGKNSGSVYIFKNNGNTWGQNQKIAANDGMVQDGFGGAVSISSQSDSSYYLISGAAGDDDNGDNSGSVYIYGDFPVGYPEISVMPANLIIDQAKKSRSDLIRAQARNSDMEESYAMGLIIPDSVKKYWEQHIRPPRRPRSGSMPSSIDWSRFDSPVKSQGSCGACSVFAAVALVENLGNQAGLAAHQDLSEQAVLACSDKASCTGGWYWDVLKYISDYGAPPDECYPYMRINGDCGSKCEQPDFIEKVAQFTGSPGLWGTNHSAEDLKAALQDGPLCVSMCVPDDGTFAGNGYKGGVYDYKGGEINWITNGHAVLLVGYDDNLQCFKVKNSWGENWGEKGYFRIAYNDVTDHVKFGSYAVSASGAYLSGETSTIIIANKGGAELVINSIQANKSWLSFSPSGRLEIMPNQQKVITVSVTDWGLIKDMSDNGKILIKSNDPKISSTEINVTAKKTLFFPEIIMGDIDDENGLDLRDAILGLQVLTGIKSAENYIRPDYTTPGIDVNGDKRIGLEEVIYILGHVGK